MWFTHPYVVYMVRHTGYIFDVNVFYQKPNSYDGYQELLMIIVILFYPMMSYKPNSKNSKPTELDVYITIVND